MIDLTQMREADFSAALSPDFAETEREPHPVTTDDLLKSVERSQILWTMFEDARERRSESEMSSALSELAREYALLTSLLDANSPIIDPAILELAKDELSYSSVVETMRWRSGRTARLHMPSALGDMDHFVL